MGNSKSITTKNPSTGSRRTDTHQHVSVPTSPPYPGSSSLSQSRSTGSSSYSSSIQIREDINPWNISTSQSSSTMTATSSGARPKQYRTQLYASGTNQQSSAAYSGTSRLNVSSSTQKVPLYMAGSFSSLCERIDQGIDWSNVSRLAGKATVVMLTANQAYDRKDEEKAYVLYERYAQMWAHIRESSDYKNMPVTFDSILGRTDIQTAYDRIDELKLSLESRYSTPPVHSSQVPRAIGAQTPASNSVAGQPQRQTFQPLEHPLAVNVTSSNTGSSGSTPSQTSFYTSSAGSTRPLQTSYTSSAGSAPLQTFNTSSAGSIPLQTSYTSSAGPTPLQTSYTSSAGPTPLQTSYTSSAGPTPSQTSSYTSSAGSTPLQTSYTSSAGPTPSQTSSYTSSAGSTPLQTSDTRSAGSTPLPTSSYTGSAGSTPLQTSSNIGNASSTLSQIGRLSEIEHSQATGTSQQQQSSAVKKDLHTGVMKGMRENLLCPICLDLFENAKSLPCGHTICEECIGEWVISKGGVLTCPTCKTEHSLPSNGVAGLATNFALNNLVGELKKLEDKGTDIEVVDEEEQPTNEATTPSLVEELQPNTATIPSLCDMVTPQQHLSSSIPSAETSFLEKITWTGCKDAKGATIKMRIQLCDTEGDPLRGRRCDKVKAMVLTPSDEKKNVSVSLMQRDGDYSLSFIPSKVGVYFVEAYLGNAHVRGSPFKVVVHPSAQFVKTIGSRMGDFTDVVVYGSKIYVTGGCDDAYSCTNWHGNWSYPCEDRFDEDVGLFAIDASNDRFYVTVSDRSCVYVYNLFGDYMNNFGKRFLESPTGIAVSSAGMIYVADTEDNAIEVFRRNFSHMHSISAGGNPNCCSLALLALNPAEDRLIAADKGTNCFKIFDIVNMKMVKMIKTRVQLAPAIPYGVAVDEDGNIFVSVVFDPSKQSKGGGHNQQNSNRLTGAIITYNSEGYFLGIFGDNELRKPLGLSIVEDKIVVVEGAGENSCLKVYKL